jgi:hypothetical protein
MGYCLDVSCTIALSVLCDILGLYNKKSKIWRDGGVADEILQDMFY